MNRRVLATLALVLAATALVPPHAAACLCGGRSDDPPVPGDLAFVGVVASREEPGLLTPGSAGGYGIRYTFAVEEVLKGSTGPFVDIKSGMGGGDCGLLMTVGERWKIFASGFEGEYWVSICGPNQLLAAGVAVPPAPLRLDPLLVIGLGAAGILAVLAIRRRRQRPEATP